jgi:hypothetical protein
LFAIEGRRLVVTPDRGRHGPNHLNVPAAPTKRDAVSGRRGRRFGYGLIADPSYRLGRTMKTAMLTSFSSSLTSVNACGQKELLAAFTRPSPLRAMMGRSGAADGSAP